jgi:hypothetical protein
MGDSRVYRGISPAEIEKGIPSMKVINFGFSAGGLNSLLFAEAEKRLTENKGEPRMIVLGITPYSLTEDTINNEQFLEEKARSWDYTFSRLYLAPFLEFFQQRNVTNIFGALLDTPQSCVGYYQNYFDDGFVASWQIP